MNERARLADQVRRLTPDWHDMRKFYEDRSRIAWEIGRLEDAAEREKISIRKDAEERP